MRRPDLTRLIRFVTDIERLLADRPQETVVLEAGARRLAELVAHDDWLPDAYAVPGRARHRQYLLHRDPAGRFSVVSFVWGPGQSTPVHDHTVWGLVGVLRGAELSQTYELSATGPRPAGPAIRLEPGEVTAVSPTIGDIHRVANAFDDRTSISIHVYGADIGRVRRTAFDEAGQPRTFVSGYAPVPPIDLFFLRDRVGAW